MLARILIVLLFMLGSAAAAADEPCPPAGAQDPWTAACFEEKDDVRRVKPAFMDRVRVDRHGVATLFIEDRFELVAVDRRGNVIVPNIRHTGDFDYPAAHLGIGRYSIVGKDAAGKRVEQCGYFQAPRFTILVPARFDHCAAFQEGKAFACTGCTRYCTDTDCHGDRFSGGRGVELRSDGGIARAFVLRQPSELCDRPEWVRITQPHEGMLILQCTGRNPGPFDMP